MAEHRQTYSTLAAKLGIGKAERVFILRPPGTFFDEIGLQPLPASAPFDYIQVFATSMSQLELEFPHLRFQLKEGGTLWVSWPKKGSSSVRDLNENIVRSLGTSAGLADGKVISVNEIWSGLKFTYRKTAK